MYIYIYTYMYIPGKRCRQVAVWELHGRDNRAWICDPAQCQERLSPAPAWRDAFICVTWLVHTCDMTRSYVWHYSWNVIQCHVRNDVCVCVCICVCVCVCVLSLASAWQDSFTCVTWQMALRPAAEEIILRTCELATAHVWMSHNTHLNESRHTYHSDIVALRMCGIRHGTHLCESWYTYCSNFIATLRSEWVTAHMWLSHSTHVNKSRHTSEWVTAHEWITHSTRLVVISTPSSLLRESCHASVCVMAHKLISHGTHLNESRHTYRSNIIARGGGLGSRPKKMYGERLGMGSSTI